MKVYVASSFLNIERVKAVEALLKGIGYEIVSHWTDHTDHDETQDIDGLTVDGIINLEDLSAADVLLVVHPGRLGTHSELGYALGAGIPAYYLFDNVPMTTFVPNPFVYVKGVTHISSLTNFFRLTRGGVGGVAGFRTSTWEDNSV